MPAATAGMAAKPPMATSSSERPCFHRTAPTLGACRTHRRSTPTRAPSGVSLEAEPARGGTCREQSMRVDRLSHDLLPAAGLPAPQGEPLAHYSPGVDARLRQPWLVGVEDLITAGHAPT